MLWTAKDVFLTMGFERATMDAIASRAGTTKRTLYAHFEGKEALFLAVVDLVQELLSGKLGRPDSYADDPVEALTRFCGQFRRTMLWGPSIRTCRLGVAEAERFPHGAARLHAVLLDAARDSIASFLTERGSLKEDRAAGVADELVRRSLNPGFTQALFGMVPVTDEWPDNDVADQEVRAAGVPDLIQEQFGREPSIR